MIPTSVTYQLTNELPFFKEITELLMAMQSLFIAVEVVRVGRIEYRPGDWGTLECRMLRREVMVPLYGPLQAAMGQEEIRAIPLGVRIRTFPSSYANYYSNLNGSIESLARGALVNYFEKHREQIVNVHGRLPPTWPSSWQMGWAIRNAISHDGRVFNNDRYLPVTWEGYTIAPTDEPEKQILNDVNAADMILLLIQMEEARTGSAVSILY